jgi:hypothetical protein
MSNFVITGWVPWAIAQRRKQFEEAEAAIAEHNEKRLKYLIARIPK